jgi:hypothetical protein
MRLGRSRRLRSVPKNTGTTAQSLAGAAPELAGGAAERVVGRRAPSLSTPLVIASLLAPTLGGIGGGAGEPTGGGGGADAEGAGGAGGDPGAGSAGTTDRFMAKVFRLGSAPVGAGGGAEALFGDGAFGRTVRADPGGVVSLDKVGRL